ncbi:DNA-binding HxlR family transcriptional regulator [Rhizobium binae]|uniref:DNA-binding HxlR family transcriptional regulator n=1 Tax=Rhizobium binae TaxID=1138190 RepID=A0ABV2MA50_9HYPH|nr:helix-turn-helix domain-containing protein [Rhizobium binae]NKL52849.1 transcriptional regulator [Rhizobium leguminosarum bv. viciae]MBX4929035.1 helix-turn-helix transcriptional regulator [Rhizobium binae]MBX4953562.1 helix-turn-helix transcriptional regulator [Rhizobium binae]MBX4966011.1 helix-turn-helix transcriptional regulator [Rhizobium binae]MBX4992258.1 helix-turn-helix transcriptional regulator [Rhizobium binae]
MDIELRSGCPINLTMEVLGDRWSLIIIRDIMFGNRRHFRDLLTHSEEGIASNILAARLKRLHSLGFISRREDPSHSQKAIYSLTEPAIQLVPLFAMIGAWGRRHLPVSEDLSIRAELLEEGGQPLWDEFMEDLRQIHIVDPIGGANGTVTSPVLTRLTAAFLEVRGRAAAAQAS